MRKSFGMLNPKASIAAAAGQKAARLIPIFSATSKAQLILSSAIMQLILSLPDPLIFSMSSSSFPGMTWKIASDNFPRFAIITTIKCCNMSWLILSLHPIKILIKLLSFLYISSLTPHTNCLVQAAHKVLDRGEKIELLSLTMSTESIIPINSLQSNQKIWTIEAMVLRQGIIETFNNVQNNGKIWKMILADNMGTKIQAVMFNEAIRKFEGIFQHSKAYLISNGTVKKPNEKFANVHPSLELVLQQHTNVRETTSTFDAHIFANEFVKFKKIQKLIEINPYVASDKVTS
ncbi:hypothetical protein F0562_015429 [Nyssa sinensis]|uniref:Replication protein A 70 kDa DNA-binding subunit B/D first OB fold domain-containing protein n=1 Tax=Nyssa sinensis TaxID=561372 RepID=A0A5J4ZHD2_9ASTE|nr:hypothetical protein F0562_015429 [Nyssa sinensis]